MGWWARKGVGGLGGGIGVGRPGYYRAYNVNSRSEESFIRNTSLWASFGIRIQEYVWNTSGILRIRAEYSPLGGLLEYVEYVFT